MGMARTARSHICLKKKINRRTFLLSMAGKLSGGLHFSSLALSTNIHQGLSSHFVIFSIVDSG